MKDFGREDERISTRNLTKSEVRDELHAQMADRRGRWIAYRTAVQDMPDHEGNRRRESVPR